MSDTQRMERITAGVMDPLYEGGYREAEVEKYAWMCLGCRLVWDRRSHAQDCEARGHAASWQQRYVSGPIINGRPSSERFYPRTALRREPPIDATADAADALLAEYEQLRAGAEAIADQADALLEEYAGGRRLRNLERISKGIYRVSLTGKEARYGIDHVNLQLVSDARYGSVKIGEWHGEGIGRVDRQGKVRLWAATDPKAPRTIALLAALEIVLGSADPTRYARAYARESATCWRCGADLVDEISRAVLMGPSCFKAEYGRAPRMEDADDWGKGYAPDIEDDQLLDSDPHDVDVEYAF